MSQELQIKHITSYEPEVGEEYMSARQLMYFRKMLGDMKTELSNDIDRAVHTMQDDATVSG